MAMPEDRIRTTRTDTAVSGKDKTAIIFHGMQGTVGFLTFKDGRLSFSGDAEESARGFLEALGRQFEGLYGGDQEATRRELAELRADLRPMLEYALRTLDVNLSCAARELIRKHPELGVGDT